MSSLIPTPSCKLLLLVSRASPLSHQDGSGGMFHSGETLMNDHLIFVCSYTGSSLIANVAYDLFTNSDCGTTPQYEIMVWSTPSCCEECLNK